MTAPMGPIRVYFSPVGCPKANIDLEKTVWATRAAGLDVVTSSSDADVVVVFTCGFIDDAKQESINDALKYAALKTSGAIKHLVVAGCLPQKYGRELLEDLPEVDVLVGNTQLDILPAVLQNLKSGAGGERLLRVGRFGDGEGPAAVGGRQSPAVRPWTRAVMICDGCDNACTYCAIPQMRGPLRSRSIRDIVGEINSLVADGAKEVVLAGQDTASYGRDQGSGRLAELLAAVAGETKAHWIRLAYANPEHLDYAVAKAIGDSEVICHYVDMPIQHASPNILSRMGRRGSPQAIRQVVDSLRDRVPDIALRTSVIVGFPGETERDFELLVGFLRDIRFDMLGVFRFSPQPDTPAGGLPNRVPRDVAEQRLIEIVSLQADIARSKAQGMLGTTLEVLVETAEEAAGGKAVERAAWGRTRYDMAEVDRMIRLRHCAAGPGDFVQATLRDYVGAYEFDAICG